MRAVPVTPRQVMFTVCGQCPSLHAEGLRAFSVAVCKLRQIVAVAISQNYELGRMWNGNEEMPVRVIRKSGNRNLLEQHYTQ